MSQGEATTRDGSASLAFREGSGLDSRLEISPNPSTPELTGSERRRARRPCPLAPVTRTIFYRAFTSAGVAAMLLLARPALAQPVIEVLPARIAFPPVTIGDTVATTFEITNLGDATLTLLDFEAQSGTIVTPKPPFDIPPDSTQTMVVDFAPEDTLAGERQL